MKKLKYESLWESHKHDKTFSDAIEVSLYRLQKKKLLIDSTDDEISGQSTRLGVKIFKAIMNVRKSFLMKEKLKELNVKLKEIKEEEEISEDDIQNESMGIDHQQVSETLEKHQKSSVTEISESESDVTEMNSDQTSNNSTYSLGHDEEIEEYSTMDENQMLLSNDNNKLKNMCTSSAVNLSEQNIQQVATGGVKRKLMDNDSNLPTTQNKRLCVVKTSTSMETNQQPGPRCAPKNDELKEKALDRSLHNEQNAWKPTARLQINNITADYKTQELYKKIRCILNKLTAENMDKLTQQVRDLNIDCHEKLKGFVDLIFDKAVDEPYFAAIYSMMCKKLADMQVDMRQENKTNFHTLLLERCQHEFERASVNKSKRDSKLKEIDKCNDIEKKRKLIALLNDADSHSCRKAVGNIRFIGELFKQDMIRISIIDRCIKDLLATPVDYNIECLCGLLTTIGAKLENSKNFDDYFSRMSSLASNKKLSSRVRYMVQNVIDLRARYWNPKGQSYPIIMNQFNNNGSQQYQIESSWEPTTGFQTCRITDNSEIQTLAKVHCILIELTPENVDKMTQQIKDLNINTHETLEGVVDLIFDKAIDKPNFASVYALMCKKLSEMNTNVVDIRQGNKIDFKTLLVTRCKHAYESVFVNQVARRDKLTTLLNDADRRLCMKAVGTIKLIGELFKQDMFRIGAIDRCIKHLLTTPVDYNIECVCELLKTVGATLKNSMNYDFNECFLKMNELTKCDEEISSRNRFMIQDVIDLRARNWKPKRDKGNSILMNQSNRNVSHQYHTKNAGKATPRLPICNITDDSSTQTFYRKVRDILNKLTQANIGESTQRIKSLGINSHKKLKCVVDSVFEKAIDEPNFTAVCAAVCEHMRQKLCREQIFDDDIKQSNNKKQGKRSITFQTLLASRCEHEFESAIVIEVVRRNKLKKIEKCYDIKKKKKLTALLNDADHRMKSVRYYKFVGELFNREFLKKVFLKKYATYLLTIPNERRIECLCELLKTIGKTLENSNDNHFNWCFQEVNSLALNEQLSSRVRCMLQDVIDLRARQWEPIRDENNTIKHVDEERASSKKDDKNIEGVLKTKATRNEPTELPTKANKQPYAIATSTSMEANQQTSIALPGSNNTGVTTNYKSNDKTFDMYRDLPQSPEPETLTRDQSMSMSLSSEGQSIQLTGSSCTNAPINYRSDDKTLDVYTDLPQSPEPETTATNLLSTSRLYVIYSHLDEQIKTLINVAIEQFKNKIDHLDYPVFIRRSLEVTVLESSNVLEKYWGFVANMITDNVFPLGIFQLEYDKMFEEINDVSPIFWTYKAEILKILVKQGAHPLKELKRTTLVLKKKGLVGNLVGELLKILLASEGQTSITDKWNNSGIEWTDLLDTSLEDPDDIIKKYNLQFLTLGKTDPLNEQLLKLLRESDIANTIKWITATVGEEKSRTPKFVRILFTLLLESGIETKYSFDKRNFYQPNRLKIINLLPLMEYYIDSNLESELECLYALTDVNHRCRNPPGFVYDIIKELHQKDIISLGAFSVWHNGTATTSELIGHDEAKWNLLCQSFWIKFQNRDD